MGSWYSVSVGILVEGVGCCHCVKASGGGEARESVGRGMHFSDMWVLCCPTPVSMALGAFVIWGCDGRGFVVGMRCGESEE